MQEQRMTVDELTYKLKSNSTSGITMEEAKYRYEINGSNFYPFLKQSSIWKIIYKCFFGGFRIFLWNNLLFCMVIYICNFLLKNPVESYLVYLSGTLVSLIVICALKQIVHFTGPNKEKVMIWGELRKMCKKPVKVLRNGKLESIGFHEVVIGDLVELQPGDLVPADLRIVHSNHLITNNYILTGESRYDLKINGTCDNDDIFQARNLALFSSVVMKGHGRGLVFNNGRNTVMQALAHYMIYGNGKLELKVEAKQMKYLLKVIGLAAGILCFMGFGGLGKPFVDAAMFFVGFNIAEIAIYIQIEEYLKFSIKHY